jgi:hypothetical protein
MSTLTLEIKLLELVLEGTLDKRIRWCRNADFVWLAEEPVSVQIREICPLIAADPETAGVQAFEVRIAGHLFYYWSGTIGASLIATILTVTSGAALNESKKRVDQTRGQLLHAISQLEASRHGES